MHNPLEAALSKIPLDYFSRYPGGWPNEISTALIDAIYSIGARYSTKNGVGVGEKVKSLRTIFLEKRPEAINSLAELTGFNESDIRFVMGNNKVAPGYKGEQYKSEAVLQAAYNIARIQIGENGTRYIDTASDLTNFVQTSTANRKKAERAYRSVAGLGPVTFEYFLMLLGVPGIKADRMLTQFVRDALDQPKLSPAQARALLTNLYHVWQRKEDFTLINFDHAIWLYQRQRTAKQQSDDN